MKLYKVEYRTYNCFFSHLLDKVKLSVGDNEEEAINRVKDIVDRDARDFKAEEISNVFGHNILVDVNLETLMEKKPLAVAVRIYQGDMFPMADIRTSPCDGSKLETIVWTNLKERNQFDYNGYTLFYDTRTEKSFSEIR